MARDGFGAPGCGFLGLLVFSVGTCLGFSLGVEGRQAQITPSTPEVKSVDHFLHDRNFEPMSDDSQLGVSLRNGRQAFSAPTYFLVGVRSRGFYPRAIPGSLKLAALARHMELSFKGSGAIKRRPR